MKKQYLFTLFLALLISFATYVQGRFRGENFMYSEVEYRKHLWATKNNPMFLGAVAYFNVTTASSGIINIFEYLNLGYGVGLRVNISKKVGTNLGIDYGWSSYGTKGLYIRLNETLLNNNNNQKSC